MTCNQHVSVKLCFIDLISGTEKMSFPSYVPLFRLSITSKELKGWFTIKNNLILNWTFTPGTLYTVSFRPAGLIIKIVDNFKLSGFPGSKMFRPAFVLIKCPTTPKMKVTKLMTSR